MDFAYLQSFFIHGDIKGAIEYLQKFPEASELLEPYVAIFEREQYLRYEVPSVVDRLLLEYQKYYRDVFYLHTSTEESEEKLFLGLSEVLGIPFTGEEALVEDLRNTVEKNGLHFQSGKTNGYYGPYVWKETVPTTYSVELPSGTRSYTVNILRGFVMRSWMDYLTFGQFGTGGWTGEDGVINCVESAYDFESDRFRVSLLKHEAQHVLDMERWKDITPEQLEYRAKLVELCYSRDGGLLAKFVSEASPERRNDSHAVASCRIQKEMESYLEKSLEEIQARARELLRQSTSELDSQSGRRQ
ncbi:MAG: hypothetical protein KBS81_07555 [Spirochaetales bacterium]|nr:hypothetical protein [Candidatus Physcosoma equi]